MSVLPSARPSAGGGRGGTVAVDRALLSFARPGVGPPRGHAVDVVFSSDPAKRRALSRPLLDPGRARTARNPSIWAMFAERVRHLHGGHLRRNGVFGDLDDPDCLPRAT